MMKKAIVIGSNASKSLSPIIFNYWFKKYNIKATYSFNEIKPQNFNKEINKILRDKSICGFNVTIPFKETISKKINSLDHHSTKIQAVNCVSRIKNKWVGKNTDWMGFSQSINSLIKKNVNKKAVVLGYGGASKAIVYSLLKEGFDEIKIYNRTLKKTKKLKNIKTISLIKKNEIKDSLKKTDIVINTTPVNVLSSLGIKKINNILAFDIVYSPKETSFLSHFKKSNRIYGISMLIYQAIPCFEDWFGVRPKIDRGILMLLNKALKK